MLSLYARGAASLRQNERGRGPSVEHSMRVTGGLFILHFACCIFHFALGLLALGLLRFANAKCKLRNAICKLKSPHHRPTLFRRFLARGFLACSFFVRLGNFLFLVASACR